jgi:alkylation response protein AidB-like acyl-CoA dehydrogenase
VDLSLTDEQQAIRDSARQFFEAECPTTLVRAMEQDDRGYPADLWERISGLGWSGLPFPDSLGGSRGTLTDLAVLLEEFGRALVPGPFFNSVAVVGLTLLDAGSDAQRSEILPGIADGSVIATAALLDKNARYGPDSVSMPADRRDGGYVLNGIKMFVEYANSADLMLVPARSDEGVVLLLVPTSADGISLNRLDSIARDPQFAVEFSDVFVSNGVVGDPKQGGAALKRALDRAALLHCAHSVGGAQHVADMTVAYTKQRVQFDRAIATFQSVQHDCADMVIAIDSARLATYEAITRIEDGQPSDKEIALAKSLTNHAYKWTTLTAQQIHGGIGFMEEYDLQLWTRRAKVAELKFGASSGHVEAFARQMGLA